MDLHKQGDVHNNLPKYWIKTKIKDICKLINGRAFKPSEWTAKGLPIIRIQNLNNDNADFNYCNFKVDEKYLVDNGQLLFAWSGTPGTSFGAHIWRRGESVLNQHIFKVEINESCVDKVYLMYLLNRNVDEYIRKAHGTAGLAHITKNKFENSFIPLAPLNQQKLIVAEIEKQFSRLDEAVASLKRIKANLKRYKAAVLKAAVEGKLTEEWRKQHSYVESASELLKHVLVERKKKWEAEHPGKKYKEPASPDTSKLPELPKGWVWASLDQLSDNSRAITYGVIKLGDHIEDGIPTLRSSNVRHLYLEMAGVKRISPALSNAYSRTILQGGEVLVTVRGTLGGVINVSETCTGYNISREVAMLVPLSNISPKCLAILMGSTQIQNWLVRNTKGIAYTGINIETLKVTPVPLMSLDEQHEITQVVEQHLSVIDEMELNLKINLKRAERLRQSILKKAFSGNLI